jgi:cytochrome c
MFIALVAAVINFQADKLENVPTRQPWVFRSVMDKRARILTIAMAKDFWLAYDATNCGLYKFWKGDVKFDGAVYTTAHGPQPTSQGGAIESGLVDQSVWSFEGKPVTPRFRGFVTDSKNGKMVVLKYELLLRGKSIIVSEAPTLIWRAGKVVGLHRFFSLSGNLTDEWKSKISLVVRKAGSALLSEKVPGNGIVTKNASGDSILTFNGANVVVDTVFNPILSQDANYTPDGYIAGLEPAPEEQPEPEAPKKEEDAREPGLAYRAWQLEGGLSLIPELVPNQTPNVNKLIKNVNLVSDEDFGLKERFYVQITGWLKIEKPGLYLFRLGSDDGARLSLRGEMVVDNDGLHSGEYKEGSLDLVRASQPLRIEMFENEADQALRLQWKKPGDKDWSFIPDENYETIADEVHVTSPGFKKVLSGLWPTLPGDGQPLNAVHPSFTLSTARPDDFTPRVGGMDFKPNGELVICTWDPEGAVYTLSGVQTGDPKQIKLKKIAIGLAEPLGLKVVNGDIYVLQKQELTRLRDLNGDGIIDEYYAVANGWGVTSNFHEFAFGLVYKDGFFYGNLATAINPGGASTRPQNFDRGRSVKISIKDGSYEFVASGFRTPNGVGQNAKGEIFFTDNQGDWLPSSKLLELKKGAFYGNRSVDPDGMKNVRDQEPVVWLPQGEIGNSPSQPTWLNIGPYKDQMIHGDVTHGGLKRVFMEKVNGLYQGTVFRFTQGLEAGINRLVWGPDNAIYVGGIGSTGNWGQEGKERFGLQRLAFNGKTTFEMLAVRPMKNGAEIEFTESISPFEDVTTLSAYQVSQWRYLPTEQYGGPKVDEERLKVKSITLNKDRKKAFLEFDGIKPKHVVYFRLPAGLKGLSGSRIWSTEAWSTVNSIPNRTGKAIAVANDESGFVNLFNGADLSAWRGYSQDAIPTGWNIQKDSLAFIPGAQRGDLMTRESFGDFELRLDWKISAGGNSGIMYRVTPSNQPAYATGVECQVLDDARHGDGKNPLTSAGSAYAMIAPNRKVVNPAGIWNSVRIVAVGSKVEHWLNGVLVVSYDTASSEWKNLVAASKFAGMPSYSGPLTGHVVLQDHGDLVAYRNIRIKKL